MDRLTSERRSWLMSRVRSENTGPERAVRSLLHRLGYRFRLHRRDLPGKPDIVLPKYATLIFVHGCYWHGHHCKKTKMPKSRKAFWDAKIAANRKRDRRVRTRLRASGWRVAVVWECELKRLDRLTTRLERVLERDEAHAEREAQQSLLDDHR